MDAAAPRPLRRRQQGDWDRRCAELARFRSEHGHFHVPRGNSLMNWVAAQRMAYRRGRLLEDRAARLEELGLPWEPGRGSWPVAAKEGQQEGGDPVPRDSTEGIAGEEPSHEGLGFTLVPRRGIRQEELLTDAILSHSQRNQLHLDIYAYLLWLHGWMKQSDSHCQRRLGINAAGLEILLTKFCGVFRDVREEKETHTDAGKDKDGGVECEVATPVPFLEGELKVELQRRAEERKWRTQERKRKNEQKIAEEAAVAAAAKAAKAPAGTLCDFDRMFECLKDFRKENGHVEVQARYKHQTEQGVLELGRWVADLRWRKRELRAEGLEVEPSDNDTITLPISRGRLGVTLQLSNSAMGAEVTEIDPACTFKASVAKGDRLMAIDDRVIARTEDLAVGKEKAVRQFEFAKKRDYPRSYLSVERVERLASIGFQWTRKPPKMRPWDERFDELLRYKKEHGQFPQRRTKGIGDWVNEQRKRYIRRDKNFMKDRAPKLEAVGFPWAIHAKAVRWEDNYERLVEFMNVNRHFAVPQPKKEDYANDKTGFEDAMRFHNWVRSLHMAYRAYLRGAKSSPRLTKEHIEKLVGIGFKFELKGPDRGRKRATQEILDSSA